MVALFAISTDYRESIHKTHIAFGPRKKDRTADLLRIEPLRGNEPWRSDGTRKWIRDTVPLKTALYPPGKEPRR